MLTTATPPRLRREASAVSRRRRVGAFTLIELLVVIAIIALLISILLPSLSAAREQARGAACGGQLRALGNGLAVYTNTFQDWIPGVNTTGVALRAMRDRIEADATLVNNPKLPVQQWDWISPILNLEDSLTGTRAERFQIITNKYRCPSQEGIESALYVNKSDGMPDEAEFRAVDSKQRFTTLSYLMPWYFQLWGQAQAKIRLGSVHAPSGGRGSAKAIFPEVGRRTFEVLVDDYQSRLDRVGPPATKIAAADGTRYLTERNILDHDVTLYPSLFGSFTSAGAWWSGSREYGVKARTPNWDNQPLRASSPSLGRNLDLSYRHGKRTGGNGSAQRNRGRINALFFDGHVSRFTDQESRNIEYWYPKGGVVNSTGEGMVTVPRGTVIP